MTGLVYEPQSPPIEPSSSFATRFVVSNRNDKQHIQVLGPYLYTFESSTKKLIHSDYGYMFTGIN